MFTATENNGEYVIHAWETKPGLMDQDNIKYWLVKLAKQTPIMLRRFDGRTQLLGTKKSSERFMNHHDPLNFDNILRKQ
jgi:hypothetical protein